MSTDPKTFSDDRLAGYLLAEGADDEWQRIEDAAASDEALSERIDMALAELLDAHAAGALSPARARAMDERLARSTELRHRFAFAKALHARAHEARSAGAREVPARRRRVFWAAPGALALAAALLLGIGSLRGRDTLLAPTATVDLVPSLRGADESAVVTLADAKAGVVLARLALPRDAAGSGPYIVRVSLDDREATFVSPSLVPGADGTLQVRIPAAALAASRASVSVTPADRPDDLVAFYELRVRRSAPPAP